MSKLEYAEVIDTPIDTQELARPLNELSRLAAEKILEYTNVEISELQDEAGMKTPSGTVPTPSIEAGRVVSWVDPEDTRTGHALVVSGICRTEHSLLQAHYYQVDRQERTVVEKHAQGITLPLNTPEHPVTAKDYADSLRQVFTRDQLVHLRHMFAKLVETTTTTESMEERVDREVLLTIQDENLEGLAPLSTPSQREAIAKLAENVFLDIGVKEALQKRAKKDSRALPTISMEATIDDVLYTIVGEYLFDSKGEPNPLEVNLLRRNQQGEWESDAYNYLTIHEDQEPDYEWDREAIIRTLETGELISDKIAEKRLKESATYW